jgi:hypothetical protein
LGVGAAVAVGNASTSIGVYAMTFIVVMILVALLQAAVSEVVSQAIMAPTSSHPTSQLVAVVLEEHVVFCSLSYFLISPA